jgi:hypothetical protein
MELLNRAPPLALVPRRRGTTRLPHRFEEEQGAADKAEAEEEAEAKADEGELSSVCSVVVAVAEISVLRVTPILRRRLIPRGDDDESGVDDESDDEDDESGDEEDSEEEDDREEDEQKKGSLSAEHSTLSP